MFARLCLFVALLLLVELLSIVQGLSEIGEVKLLVVAILAYLYVSDE